MAWDWERISVLTRDMLIGDLEDQVLKGHIVFDRLNRKNKVEKKGGDYITERVILALNPNVGSYSGYDELSDLAVDAFGKAQLKWANYYGLIHLPMDEVYRNQNSPEALFDIITSETNLTKDSVIDKLHKDIFADGTGNNGKELDGFKVAVDDGTNYATYAGINRSTYTAWKANYFANGGVARAVSFALLNRALAATETPKGMANFAVTTRNILCAIEEVIVWPKESHFDEKEASAGFENILFKGRPIYSSDKCPAGYLYWLNDNYIKLVVNPAADFDFDGFLKVPNQNVVVGRIFWQGNLVVLRPSGCAVVKDLSESIAS